MRAPKNRIRDHLEFLYGEQEAEYLWPQVAALMSGFRRRNPGRSEVSISSPEILTEKDVFLITYADQFNFPGCMPLACLSSFLETYLQGAISGVHLLPFFPSSSDDGFSVIDFREVNPDYGDWQDVAAIGDKFRLMFDAVINHVSQHSDWFQSYLRGEPAHQDFFLESSPEADLSQVERPRALPLLTRVHTNRGERHVWTTFSDDQIDLNYANPQVLLEIISLLLFYVERGAEVIRLDAVAYLWKKIGTRSIHLPQTHRIVKLFRGVLDAVAPGVLLITETNVPHRENISYFGEQIDGTDLYDEAQMVYQFPLAPLVLHSFHSASAATLTRWAASLRIPAPTTTFFNFIASHDGIGLKPARGLLLEEEIQALVDRTLAHGGQVSYKTNQDGSWSVYELNTTLFDALNDPANPLPDLDIDRFIASQVIMLSIAGVPGIYAHSLFGTRNCHTCAEKAGRARSINREKFHLDELKAELGDAGSRKARVLSRIVELLKLRRGSPAFHPSGAQRVLELHESVFSLLRTSPDGEESILCLVNVSPKAVHLRVESGRWHLETIKAWRDLLRGGSFQVREGVMSINVGPYGTLWLHGQPL